MFKPDVETRNSTLLHNRELLALIKDVRNFSITKLEKADLSPNELGIDQRPIISLDNLLPGDHR
jgi:hypothetical protein